MILEILISTMNRMDLKFLDKMFTHNHICDYLILIINQTINGNELKSNSKNIRVINSYDKGLSKSRNLAIKNSIGDIILIADDDIIYEPKFENKILEAFIKHRDAGIVTFRMQDENGNLFKKYPLIKRHNRKSLESVNSVVIAFKKQIINNYNLQFNTLFGLGAPFSTGEEYIFLMDAFVKNLNIYFEKDVILTHNHNSSGRKLGTDSLIYARSAIMRKLHGSLAKLYLLKYIVYSILNKEIKPIEFMAKYNMGLKGIKDYEKCIKP